MRQANDMRGSMLSKDTAGQHGALQSMWRFLKGPFKPWSSPYHSLLRLPAPGDRLCSQIHVPAPLKLTNEQAEPCLFSPTTNWNVKTICVVFFMLSIKANHALTPALCWGSFIRPQQCNTPPAYVCMCVCVFINFLNRSHCCVNLFYSVCGVCKCCRKVSYTHAHTHKFCVVLYISKS